MLIFRKARTGELQMEGLAKIAAVCDVTKEGVGGAKTFFEAKVKEQAEGARFEKEVREEQERKKKEAEEAKERKQAFKEKASMWHWGHLTCKYIVCLDLLYVWLPIDA